MCVSVNTNESVSSVAFVGPCVFLPIPPKHGCTRVAFSLRMYRASSLALQAGECASSRAFRQQLCLPAEEIDGNLFVLEAHRVKARAHSEAE